MQQQILAASPKANVRIYAVWFNMLPNDSRGKFPTDLLTDSRVTHFWDENHWVGTAFAPLADWHKGVLWDAYFLYGPDARWPSAAAASPPPETAGERRRRPEPIRSAQGKHREGSPPQQAGAGSGVTATPALPQPASWGRTIFSTRELLRREFSKMMQGLLAHHH